MKTLALIGLACGCLIRPADSQVTGTIDAAVSSVRYDGFLTSGAVALTPAVRWEHPGGRGFVTARGTYLRFESGNRSLDGSATASWFTPLAHQWRGELAVAGGASDYADIATFAHGAVEGRVHLIDATRGGWFGATVGRASFGARPRPVSVVALGVWTARADLTLFASVDRSLIGDTSYTDVRSSARLRQAGGTLVLEGAVGARVWSRGGGRGLYGEGSAMFALGRTTALIFSAGRYPTDVITGSIAGRYVSAAIRLGSISPRDRVRDQRVKAFSGRGSDPAPADARMEILVQRDDQVRITMHAPIAESVEITGDFTDWVAAPLTRTALGTWEGTFRIPRGVHRINVRINGGPWTAPAGTTRSLDDFDGEVGVFILP